MSPDELDDEMGDDAVDTLDVDEGEGDDETRERLDLKVKIDAPSACQRHVTVTIPRDDVDRYFDDAYSEMMPTAAVPGFRPGRAPRKLVESRFRKEVSEQIKGSLLMDSLTQISEDEELTAISEPELDLEAVEIPDEGPMTFEFDIEVRPDFELPEWKGLKIDRPVREILDEEVDRQAKEILGGRYGRLVPYDGAAEAGDSLTVNIVTRADGKRLAAKREEVVRALPTLSFQDGTIEGFDKLMIGARAGQTREADVTLSAEADEHLQGQNITAEFEILEVKKLEMPELTTDFWEEIGFDSEDDFKSAIRSNMERRVEYYFHQNARRQITAALVEAADWELPPSMLRKQASRELDRAVMELRRNGFSEPEIRARENELRQHSLASTARALKEHFILERIAEEEEIDAEPHDYDAEIDLMARQSGESPRRVRAYLEKRGLMDVLRNQILERKVIELVMEHARFVEKPFQETAPEETEAIDMAAGGAVIEAEEEAEEQS